MQEETQSKRRLNGRPAQSRQLAARNGTAVLQQGRGNMRWKLLTFLAPLIALAAFIITGCNGGSSGGAGGGAGVGPVISPFTITPDRAAPGAIVRLSGVGVPGGTDLVVDFNGVPAQRIRRGTGYIDVMVPLFTNGTDAPVTPAGPVAVKVTAVGRSAVTASNAFYALDLPAAPGRVANSLKQLEEIVNFFEFLADASAPGDLAPNSNTIEGENAIFARLMAETLRQQLLTGPDSLKAILTGTAPSLEGTPFPPAVLDSMFRQAGVLDDLAAFAIDLRNNIMASAAPVSAARVRRPVNYDLGGKFTANEAVLIALEDSKQQLRAVSTAEEIVALITAQRSFAAFESGIGEVLDLADDIEESVDKAKEFVAKSRLSAAFKKIEAIISSNATLKRFVDKTSQKFKDLSQKYGKNIKAIVRPIAVIRTIALVSTRIAFGFAAALPNRVADFYIRLGPNAPRLKEGSPPYQLRVNQTVPIQFFVTLEYGGNEIMDKEEIHDTVKEALQNLADKTGGTSIPEEVVDFAVEQTVKTVIDRLKSEYQRRTGKPIPFINDEGSIIVPVRKGDERLLTENTTPAGTPVRTDIADVTTTSTRVLRIEPIGLNEFRLNAIDFACNVGIRPVVKYTKLATYIRESGTPIDDFGTSIDVKKPDGTCPNPTPPPTRPPGCNGTTAYGNECGIKNGVQQYYNCTTGACEPFKVQGSSIR